MLARILIVVVALASSSALAFEPPVMRRGGVGGGMSQAAADARYCALVGGTGAPGCPMLGTMSHDANANASLYTVFEGYYDRDVDPARTLRLFQYPTFGVGWSLVGPFNGAADEAAAVSARDNVMHVGAADARPTATAVNDLLCVSADIANANPASLQTRMCVSPTGAVTTGLNSGTTDATLSESGIAKSSAATETFTFTNPGAGVLNVSADGSVTAPTVVGTSAVDVQGVIRNSLGANLEVDEANLRFTGAGTITTQSNGAITLDANGTGVTLVADAELKPTVTDVTSLGTTALQWSRVHLDDGSAAAPSLSWEDGQTGMIGSAAGGLGFIVSNAEALRFDASAFLSNPSATNGGRIIVADGIDPSTNDTQTLGSETAAWDEIHLDGGTAAAPAIDFDGGENGFYSAAVRSVSVACDGLACATFQREAAGGEVSLTLATQAGSSAKPSIHAATDPDTGISWFNSNRLTLDSGGTAIVDIAGATMQINASVTGTQVTTGAPATWRVPVITGIGGGGRVHPTCSALSNAGQMYYADNTGDGVSGGLCVCRANSAGTYANVRVDDNTTACPAF